MHEKSGTWLGLLAGWSVAAAGLVGPALPGAWAQDLITPPKNSGVSPGTEGTDVGEAGRIIVTGVTPDQSILPTVRPISSIYGTEMNIVDTPRDVSTITKEQVSFRQITSVDDLGQFA